MENIYNDELMPENFEQIAKAYATTLKRKGFVFVRLEEEAFNFLLDEVYILIAKMKSCLIRLNKILSSHELEQILNQCEQKLFETFGNKKPHKFECVENENATFLSLISLENMLIIKLMLLSIKSEELEICNDIITSVASIFAESFPCDGFLSKY